MKCQAYLVTVHEPEKVKPAQFIHHNNDDQYIRGFVADVYEDGKALFVLFEATDIDKTIGEVVSKKLDDYIIKALLKGALTRNPDMEEQWASLE